MTCCLMCPWDKVDWNREGGLICCNVPCGNDAAKQNITHWYVDEDNGNRIIVPNNTAILSCWMVILPWLWIYACLMPAFCHASAFIFYVREGKLAVEHRTKFTCFEVKKFHRNSISEVNIETGKSYWGKTTVCLNIHSSYGVTDKGKVTVLPLENDILVIERLIELLKSQSNSGRGGLVPIDQRDIPIATEVELIREEPVEKTPTAPPLPTSSILK